MPTYVYRCDQCGTEFEAFQRFSDDPLRFCPAGHEGARRVFTPAGIIFKGSGWYIKDSKTDGGGSGGGSRSRSSTGNSSSDASKGEGKSESKSSSTSEVKSEAA